MKLKYVRLTILISFCYKVIGVHHVCKKLPKQSFVWQSYCKKWCSFFYSR